MAPPRPTPWTWIALLAVGATLAACSSEPEGPDLSTPTSAFDAAMAAVADRDLTDLWPILTPRAKAKVEMDLRAWQLRLRDAGDGPRILAEVKRLRPETTDAEYAAARDGSIADVWVFFLRAKPRPATPKKSGLKLDPAQSSAQIAYEDVHGTVRVVTLVKSRERWYVDDLPL